MTDPDLTCIPYKCYLEARVENHHLVTDSKRCYYFMSSIPFQLEPMTIPTVPRNSMQSHVIQMKRIFCCQAYPQLHGQEEGTKNLQ